MSESHVGEAVGELVEDVPDEDFGEDEPVSGGVSEERGPPGWDCGFASGWGEMRDGPT